MTPNPELDPRFAAAVDLLRRTGATNFRIGYSDEDDGDPIVWYAVVNYPQGNEADAGLNATTAVLRLCERVIDGGKCTHCGRPTIFDPDFSMGDVMDSVLDKMGCRYKWDAETASFVRSCE